jgi:hypothetical protein
MAVGDLVWHDLVRSSGEEEDGMDAVEPDHDYTLHKVPHLLPTITPRWCFPRILLCSSLSSHDNLVAK